MNTKEISEKYAINQYRFERYLKERKLGKFGLISCTLDEDIEFHVNAYKQIQAEKAAVEEAKKREAEELEKEKEELERRKIEANEEKQKAMSRMLISSGFSFEGYKITKYSGYISGDDCITMPRDNFWGTNKVADNLCGALVKIRRQAIKELKEAAYDLGCNAVVGVDFDYLTMDPQHAATLAPERTVYEPYVICVTANGNAVVIEKIEEDTP